MRRVPFVLASVLLIGWQTEAAGGQLREEGAVVAVVSQGIANYNATGITATANGQQYLYMYVQSANNQECKSLSGGTYGDTIELHRAPVQADGTPGAFTRVGRISPCVLYPNHADCLHPGPPCYASFGPGQVFRATVNGQLGYQILADYSDWINFHHIWRGYSADGLSWTWEVTGQPNCPVGATCADPVPPWSPAGFPARTITWKGVAQPILSIDPALGVPILNPIMLATQPSTNNAEWWGYLKYIDYSSSGWTTTPMRIVWSSGAPSVHLLAGTAQPFSYTAIPNNRITSLSQLKPVMVSFQAKTLLLDAGMGVFQVWGHDYLSHIYGKWISCTAAQQPTFSQNTSGSPQGSGFSWYDVNRFNVGRKIELRSTSRFMPSGYSQARAFPFRWNAPNGRRFLFSATADGDVCTSVPAHDHTVRSELVSTAATDGYYPVMPCRAYDTRSNAEGALQSGIERIVALGSCGVPIAAKAAAVNLTIVGPTAAGQVSLHPRPGQGANTTVVAFAAQQVRANNATIGVTNGTLTVRPQVPAGATVDVIVDVVGYFY